MGFTTARLTNNGQTAHYKIEYDDTLSPADGQERANALIAKCEQDFTLISGWFGGINLLFSYPIPVQIANASGGASWSDPPDLEVMLLHPAPTITLNPGNGTSVDFVRYLLVSEVTEMFMASQKRGWFEPTNLFQGADEGSKGEGLSRFLAAQFQLANGLGSVPPPGYGVTPFWLNSPRQDFITNNPDDHKPNSTNGCTTLFLYYLHNQLGKSINAIIAAGASNLAGVYQNLTGKSDAWNAFIGLVNSHYPPAFTYDPPDDNLFPVAELSAFDAPPPITCGYSDTSTQIFIDHPAMAEVNIQLTSDDPSLVSVSPFTTIPAQSTSTFIAVTTTAIAVPFTSKSVNVHADYAGKRLTISVTVVPPGE